MSEVVSIEIVKEVPFFGEGDSLDSRLRKVSLRGFPDVKIYGAANFEYVTFFPDQARRELYTSQPSVYRSEIDRVHVLARLFQQKGVDLFHLTQGYDYVARDENGKETQWTLIPPVVERWHIPRHEQGGFNYESLVGDELRKLLADNNWTLNSFVHTMARPSAGDVFDLINDGMHRVHAGLEIGKGVTVLRISGITPGFPYYAAPQSYSLVQVHDAANPTTTALKKYVVTDPGQKQLYRVFPSGGILTGDVRPATKGEVFH